MIDSIKLLKAKSMGVRELKNSLSRVLKRAEPVVVTLNGGPVKVLISYSTIVDLLEFLDELKDKALRKQIEAGRKAFRKSKGYPVG